MNILNSLLLSLSGVQVISELSELVEVAKRLADTRTTFERLQAHASRLYYSRAYQLVVNAMLFLVVHPSAPKAPAHGACGWHAPSCAFPPNCITSF
jgi:hypothetical protein